MGLPTTLLTFQVVTDPLYKGVVYEYARKGNGFLRITINFTIWSVIEHRSQYHEKNLFT